MVDEIELYRKRKQEQRSRSALANGATPGEETGENVGPSPLSADEYIVRKDKARQQNAAAAALRAANSGDPDTNAADDQLAFEYKTYINPEVTPPASFVATNRDRMQADLQRYKMTTTLSTSPMLTRWLDNTANARVAADDVGALANIEAGLGYVRDALKRGVVDRGAQVGAQIVADANLYAAGQRGRTFGERYKDARGASYGSFFGVAPEGGASIDDLDDDQITAFFKAATGTAVDWFLGAAGKSREDNLSRAADFQRIAAEAAAATPLTEGPQKRFMDAYASDKPLSMGEAAQRTLDLLVDDPATFFAGIGLVGVESIGSVIPAAVATAATRNPAVGAATMGATSYTVERNLTPVQFFTERGYDLTKPEDVQRMLTDPVLMREAAEQGHVRGLIIGALDWVSGGVAGRALAKNPAADAAIQAMVQAGLGGGGEGFAQYATEGEVDFGEVIVEALAEFATAPVDVTAVGARKLGERRVAAQRAQAATEALEGLAQEAVASKLRERSPDKFREFVAEATEGGSAETMYIPADAFTSFFQSQGVEVDAIAEALPGVDVEQVRRAAVTGEDVAVPTATYLTHVAGTDMDAFIVDNAKFAPDDMTRAEALAFSEDEKLQEARVAAAQEAARETQQAENDAASRLQETLTEQLVEAGRPRAAAQQEAQLYPAFYTTMAQRMGVSLDELLARYQPPEVRGPQVAPLQGKTVDAITRDLAAMRERLRSGRTNNVEAAVRDAVKAAADLVRRVDDGPQMEAAEFSAAIDAAKAVEDTIPSLMGLPTTEEFNALSEDERRAEGPRLAPVQGAFGALFNAIHRDRRTDVEAEVKELLDAYAVWAGRTSQDEYLDAVEKAVRDAGLDPETVTDEEVRAALAKQELELFQKDITDLGWTFKDVKKMPFVRGLDKKIETRIQNGVFREERVRLRSVFATQGKVNEDFATPKSDNNGNPPVVVRYKGEFYLRDGHHRAVKQAAEGAQAIDVFLVDMDGPAAETPLLDYEPPKALSEQEKKEVEGILDALFDGNEEAAKKYASSQELFQPAPPEGSDAFTAWAGTDEVIEADAVNEFAFRGSGPFVVRAFHGTTHDFSIFDATVHGTKEGQFGAVNYFTTSEYDASANYGGRGPDLTNRIENLRERIRDEAQALETEARVGRKDADPEEIFDEVVVSLGEMYGFDTGAIDYMFVDNDPENGIDFDLLADAVSGRSLDGGNEKVMEVFVRTENPFIVGGDTDSWIEFTGDLSAIEQEALERVADDEGLTVAELQERREEFEDQIDEARWDIEGDTPNKLHDAVREVADRYGLDAHEILGEFIDVASDTEATHTEFEAALRGLEAITFAEDPENGDLIGHHVLGEVIQELGFDSIILKNADKRFPGMDMDGGTAHVHVFDANNTNIKSATDNVGTFDRTDPDIYRQEERGRIAFPAAGVADGRAVIDLFKSADLSTFLHESGHYFLSVLQDAATREGAPQDIIGMYESAKGWWRENAAAVAKDGGAGLTEDDVLAYLDKGTTGDDAKDRAASVGVQEQWARAFETYLLEGKAPTARLRAAFEQFRAWLLEVYRKVKGDLNVQVTDDIRQVFDMLLATDADIAAANVDNSGDMIAATAAELGISEEDYGQLAALHREARDEMAARAIRDAMAPVRRAREAAYRERYAAIREEVAVEVNARPVYRAIEWMGNKRWLGTGEQPSVPTGMRLSKEQLVERYGPGVLRTLPRGSFRVYTPGGMDIDEAAGWFGFSSGDELVKAMESAPRREDVIANEADARATAELSKDEGVVDAAAYATEAFHTDKRGDYIAAELRTLNIRIGGKDGFSTASYARQVARNTISGMKTRDAIASNRYLAAERRAAEAAQVAFVGGDLRTATDQKRKQLFNHMMYVESRKVAEEVGKAKRLADRLSSKGTRKNLAKDYLGAIDDVLEQYDFRKIGPGREARRERLLAYVEKMKAEGRENELAIPQHVLDAARPEPYMTLPVERLRGVYATLKNIESTARRAQKLIDAKSERDMDQIVSDITDAFAANVKAKPPARVASKGEAARRGARQFMDLVLNADTLLREVDGFQDADGMAYQHIKRGLDEATARLQVRRRDAAKVFEDLYSVYDTKERNRMAVAEFHPELGASFAKWDLIAIVLNMGNADNIQRLTDPKVKGAFTKQQLDWVLAQMDKRDMDFVQSVWDYVGSFYSEIAAREKRVTGVAPQRVEARPLDTPHGQYRGGYYPLKYDPRLSSRVAEESAEEVMNNMRAGRFGKAQTRNGHTKERAQSSGRAVLLDIGVLHSHINTVLHDLELSEQVTNTWRILQEPRIKGLFYNAGRQVDHQALEMWVQDAASGQVNSADVLSRTARFLKSGFTVSKLAFNLSTVAVQITGVAQSMVVIGKKNFLKGAARYLSSPVDTSRDVVARSSFMAERETTFNKDIYDIMGDIKVGPKAGAYKRIMQNYMGPLSFYLMQKVQFYAVDMPTWLGAYQKALADTGNDEAASIQTADRAVARSQASGIFSDRSPVERGTLTPNVRQNDFVRLFTALGSYMFAKANVAYERTGKTDFRSPREVLSYTIDMALLFTVEAVLYNAIKGTLPGMGDDDDDESWVEFIALETALAVMGTIPFVRDLASPLQGYSGGGSYGSISETLTKPFLQASQGELDKAFVKSVVDSGGMLLHLPGTQANRVVDAWWRQSEGEDVAPIEYIMGKR